MKDKIEELKKQGEILAWNATQLAAEKRRMGDRFLGPQMTPHRKPNAGGGACDVCGCPGIKQGVRHWAMVPGKVPGAAYAKSHKDRTGDSTTTFLDYEGRPV